MKIGSHGEYVLNEAEARAFTLGHQMAMENVRQMALLHFGHVSARDTTVDRLKAYHKFLLSLQIGEP